MGKSDSENFERAPQPGPDYGAEHEFQEQTHTAERQSFLELTRSIAGLPLEQAAAVLETSAGIAAISLRAGIEFLRTAPVAAETLAAAELRSWGELGRRIAMSDFEMAIAFFSEEIGRASCRERV